MDTSSKMIRTLCVLFFAIVLREYSTGTLEWDWVIPMGTIIICFMLVNAIVVSQQKNEAE